MRPNQHPPRFFLVCLVLLAFSLALQAADYAGQEQRSIKSLSQEDQDQIKAGKGWGLAKAAELSGYPGPKHLLDLAQELGLSPEQKQAIARAYQSMKEAALDKGKDFLKAERALDEYFAQGKEDPKELARLVQAAGEALSRLRLVHLEAHLGMKARLKPEQIQTYQKLRGYASEALDSSPMNQHQQHH